MLFTLSAEWDSDMASLLVLLHLLTPQPAGRKRPKKISVGEATEHLVKFQKVCLSIYLHFTICIMPALSVPRVSREPLVGSTSNTGSALRGTRRSAECPRGGTFGERALH